MALSSDDIAAKISAKKQRRENRRIREENAQKKLESGDVGKLTDMFGVRLDPDGEFKLAGGDTYTADFDKIRESQAFKKMARETFGKDAVAHKFRDGETPSDSFIDSVLDRNYGSANIAAAPASEPEPYVPSKTYSDAKQGIEDYREFRRNPPPIDRGFMGGGLQLNNDITFDPMDRKSVDAFKDSFKLKLLGSMYPGSYS